MGWHRSSLAAGFLVVALFAGPSAGLAAPEEASERQQLAAERRAADARFDQAQSDCRRQFAFNACVDEARANHRRALAGLKVREQALDEGLRRQRALERQSAIDRRQRVAEERPAEPLARKPGRAASSALPSAARRDGEARRARDAAAAQARAAERAASARRLQAAMEADQARIKERLAKREAQGRKAQPLPSPASAPAAR